MSGVESIFVEITTYIYGVPLQPCCPCGFKKFLFLVILLVFLFEVFVFFVQAESSGSGEQVKPYSFILISVLCNVNLFTMDSIPSAGLC